MRISTSMIHTNGSATLSKGQSELYKLQQQLATGKRILTPADDPLGAARAVAMSDRRDANTQFATNQANAKNKLALAESTVGDVEETLQDIRARMIQGGNGALSDTDRRIVASDLRAMYDRLLALANSRDSAGNFMFAGLREAVQPFTDTTTGATYNGDQGKQTIAVNDQRTIAVSENGMELFQRIRTGNGTFTTTASATNTGTGVVTPGAVVNPAALTGDTYTVTFNVVGTTTTYDVFNVTTATMVSAGNAYTSGAAITVAGMQFSVSGAPANTDVVTLASSQNQSVFTTIRNMITALQSGQLTPTDSTRFANSLAQGLANIDQAIDKVLGVRGAMGANLKDLELEGDVNRSRNTEYETQLSQVRDLDYAKAISEFARREQALEAAQASYSRISQRTLFDYL